MPPALDALRSSPSALHCCCVHVLLRCGFVDSVLANYRCLHFVLFMSNWFTCGFGRWRVYVRSLSWLLGALFRLIDFAVFLYLWRRSSRASSDKSVVTIDSQTQHLSVETLIKWPSVQWFSKWAESPPWGRTKQRGDRVTKQRKGGETAQPCGFYSFPYHIWLKRNFRLWLQCSQSKETACWFISDVIYDHGRRTIGKLAPGFWKFQQNRLFS